MSSTNRRDRYSSLVVIVALFAIVAIAWLYQSPHRVDATENPTQVEFDGRSDSELVIASHQQFEPWADSYAQWLMAVFSVVATFVSIWAVLLLRRTLLATRDAVRAADEAVIETRRIGEAQVRAYVTVLNPKCDFVEGAARLTFDLHNSGNSPARDIIAVSWFYVSEANSSSMPTKVVGGGMGYGTIRPAQTLTGMQVKCNGCFCQKPQEQSSLLMQIHLVVNFNDVFGANHEFSARFLTAIQGAPPKWKSGNLVEPAPYSLTELERRAERHELGEGVNRHMPGEKNL